jgi:MFS family permease
MLRRWRASKWIPLVAFLWGEYPSGDAIHPTLLSFSGIMAVSMAAVTGFKSLFTCRFLLGSLQCSFNPAFAYYISLWYQKRQQALRFGSIWAFSALGGAFGGFLAYAIGHIESEYWSEWQLIFIVSRSLREHCGRSNLTLFRSKVRRRLSLLFSVGSIFLMDLKKHRF